MIALLMTRSALLEPWLGAAPDGGPLLGPPVSVPCRLEPCRALAARATVTYGDRETERPRALLFLPAGTNVPVGSRLTVDGVPYRALEVCRAEGFRPHHLEVIVC